MFGADGAPTESAEKDRRAAESDRSVRTEDYANENQAMAPSKVVKKGTDQPVLFNPNDDDFIDKVNKPMKPLTKDQIIRQLQAKNVVPLGFPATGGRRSNQRERAPSRKDAGAAAPVDHNAAFAGSFQGSSNDQFRLGNIRSNAELKGVNRLEDINLTLNSRPASGVHRNASQTSVRQRRPEFKGKGRKLQTTKKRGNRDMISSARRAIDGFGPEGRSFRHNDQEIHDGIEKFQAML